MAACGSLQHLFDKTLPENPTLLDPFSPWKAIKNMKPVHNASFTEIFGELHHHQQQQLSSSPPSSPEIGEDEAISNASPNSCRRGHSKNSSSENLSTCTEGLGFESSDDVEELGNDSEKKVRMSRQSSSKRSTTHKGVFPPPISCIGRTTGKPWVCFRSYREDGRFILQEVRFPAQEFLHACREDGRLRLQYIQSDEEILEGDEDEDEHQDSIGDDVVDPGHDVVEHNHDDDVVEHNHADDVVEHNHADDVVETTSENNNNVQE